MKTIHKYKIEIVTEQVIELPWFHRILCIKLQNGTPYIWVEVDDDTHKTKVKFHLFGTGHVMPDTSSMNYIGTILLDEDRLVYHLYRQL